MHATNVTVLRSCSRAARPASRDKHASIETLRYSVTEFPPQRSSLLGDHFFSDFFRRTHTLCNSIVHHDTMAQSKDHDEMQMQLALECCHEVDRPNFSAIARQFPPVNCQTLKCRFEGSQSSRAQANSNSRQCLSIEQEKQLISHINMLTKRHLPPTSAIVWNLAEEIIGRAVGKN